MAISAGIGAVGSIAGGLIGSRGASNAANAQAAATREATAAQLGMFNQTRESLAPFINMGGNSGNMLSQYLSGGLENSPLLRFYQPYQNQPAYTPINYNRFAPTMQQLEQTPGYQFTLDQGLKATDNKLSALGLSGSGANVKALADYATGLASQTYQQQFQNNLAEFSTDLGARTGQYQLMADNARADYGLGFNSFNTSQNNAFNKLIGMTGIGANAAAGQASNATQVGGQIGSNIIGGGNAAASGIVGSANALSGGLTSAANSGSQYFMMNQLLQRMNGGGGYGATNTVSNNSNWLGSAGFGSGQAPGGFEFSA